jgi:hypothetical protein
MATRAKLIPLAFACGMAGTLAAQESEAPDLSFLEFLGSWEEEDDEWIIFDGLAGDAYEIETTDVVLVAAEGADGTENADEARDTDVADDTVESGESSDVDGTDERESADAN